jgi:hypothetical protein
LANLFGPGSYGLSEGVAAALIASRKGRSVVGWGILGLIFSVIAVIVVAVLPKRNG